MCPDGASLETRLFLASLPPPFRSRTRSGSARVPAGLRRSAPGRSVRISPQCVHDHVHLATLTHETSHAPLASEAHQPASACHLYFCHACLSPTCGPRHMIRLLRTCLQCVLASATLRRAPPFIIFQPRIACLAALKALSPAGLAISHAFCVAMSVYLPHWNAIVFTRPLPSPNGSLLEAQ